MPQDERAAVSTLDEAVGCSNLPAGVSTVIERAASTLEGLNFAFTVADCSRPDMPITYASSSFFELTGYTAAEVLGRNCRFLQGKDTSRQQVMEIRDAIREDRACSVCLLNYKASGEPFWNQFHLSPVCDEAGRVTHYVGIQAKVSAAVAAREASAAAGGEEAAGISLAAAVLDAQAEAELLHRVLSSATCCAASSLPSSLLQPLMRVQSAFVLSDPKLPDSPIVFASDQFLAMTGYAREEVCGRNCRFLQGPGTDPREVARLREALAADPPLPVTVTLLNYRKDGTRFWNALHVAAVRDADGRVEYLVGVQMDVSEGGGCDGSASPGRLHLRHRMAHMGATGAVRVACRSLTGSAGGLRRSLDFQGLPPRGYGSQRRSISGLRAASMDGRPAPMAAGGARASGLGAYARMDEVGEAAGDGAPRHASGPASVGQQLMEERLGGGGEGDAGGQPRSRLGAGS